MNADEQLRKLSHAVEQCGSAIIITDKTGTIEYANPRFAELTGYSMSEVIGSNPRMLKSGETPAETYTEMWSTIHAGHVWRGEVKNKRKDGSLYWGNLTVAPVKEDGGDVTHFIGIEEDITQQKMLESQLRAANEELIHSNLEMKQFTNIASHDLKAPLSTITSALSLLLETHAASLNDDARQLVDIAANQANKMLLLLTDLLSYTRTGAKKAVHEPVDLGSVVETVRENLSVTLFEKKAQIVFSELPTITASRTLMTLLLQNLIENGIKYCTSPSPLVTVNAEPAGDKPEWRISVTDNGIGFEMSDAQKIFEPFTRLPTQAKFPGTGLGLATCKRIVEIFGGKI